MQNFIKHLANLDWIDTNHNGVFKKVCFVGEEFASNITQVAYTELEQGVEVAAHIHISMEEVFFLVEGICEFNIQGETILAKKQSVIKIPMNKEHSLRVISKCKFFYFGVSI